MAVYDSFDTLSDLPRRAVVDLLYRLADDELIIGHCDAEWAEHGPLPEDAGAFSSLAQDEIAHSRIYYGVLHELGEPAPEALAYSRGARQFRCASLVSLPARDWAFVALRRFLYDTSENVRLAALSASALKPLALLAGSLYSQEKDHLSQSRAWVLHLSQASEADRLQMQEVLTGIYPHALGLFEPTETDDVLARTAISPTELQLRREWEAAVAPVLTRANLQVNEAIQPTHGGRVGQHPKALAEVLAGAKRAHGPDPNTRP
jgi:ring-1,2-phenylacetyl-CoA epoxidase subunit PaaC